MTRYFFFVAPYSEHVTWFRLSPNGRVHMLMRDGVVRSRPGKMKFALLIENNQIRETTKENWLAECYSRRMKLSQ